MRSTRASSSASSGPSRTRSPGRRWTCRGRCASGCGTTARPPSSSRRRSAPATTSPSSATGSACATPRELRVGSPFRFDEQALLYLPERDCPTRAPRARSSAWPRRRPRSARSRAGARSSSTSSYRALDAIAARLRGAAALRRARPGRGAARAAARALRREVDSVLVATATFWQGVDVPGEALSLLVIDKLPFPAPGDPLVEARCERITAEGGDWFARLLAAGRRAPAAPGLRPADPHASRPRRRRDPRSARADAALRTDVPRGAAALPRSCPSGRPWRASSPARCQQQPANVATPVAKKARTPKPPRLVERRTAARSGAQAAHRPVADSEGAAPAAARRYRWFWPIAAAVVALAIVGVGARHRAHARRQRGPEGARAQEADRAGRTCRGCRPGRRRGGRTASCSPRASAR